MAMVCTEVKEWIETHISKPVEEWENQQEKKCKKRHWYDPRSWFCWFVTILVKVIRWVFITILTEVVTIVCHLVADVLSILWNILKFLGNLIKALVTWDKCTLQKALGNIFDAAARLVEAIGDVIIRPITDRIQTYRLRKYVGHKVDQQYWQQPDLAVAIKEKLNVETGVFGYRLTCTIHTMYVDSLTMTGRYTDVPNLFGLHRDGLIDLYQLAGFKNGCAIWSKEGWYRPRHQTATYPFAGGGGLGEPTPPRLKKEQLDEYIDTQGQGGPHFRIYAISPGDLDKRTDAAEEKGRQLGLILSFERKYKEVIDPQFINYNRTPINPVPVDCASKNKGQTDFLVCEIGRKPKSDFECCHYDKSPEMISGSIVTARDHVCSPAAVAVFGFTDKETRGLTSNPFGTTTCAAHNLTASVTSGLSFIDDIPDEMRKYVLIHELGHYFGLCHVDGFDRIMVSGEKSQGDWFTWKALPNVFWHGGPRFIYNEATRAWDFIVENFPPTCLALVPPPPVPPPPVIL